MRHQGELRLRRASRVTRAREKTFRPILARMPWIGIPLMLTNQPLSGKNAGKLTAVDGHRNRKRIRLECCRPVPFLARRRFLSGEQWTLWNGQFARIIFHGELGIWLHRESLSSMRTRIRGETATIVLWRTPLLIDQACSRNP